VDAGAADHADFVTSACGGAPLRDIFAGSAAADWGLCGQDAARTVGLDVKRSSQTAAANVTAGSGPSRRRS